MRSRSTAALLLALATLAGCDRGSRPTMIGRPAPNFTVSDGQRSVTLSSFRGRTVLLNFWASWCQPCIEEAPSMVALQRQMPSLVVLGISTDEDAEAYRRFLEEQHVNFLTVRDGAQRSSSMYRTTGIPETYVIDRGGVVRRRFIGPVDWTSPAIVSYLNEVQRTAS